MQAYYNLLTTNYYVTRQRFAIDIETIPTCNDPSFTDPSDWETFAVVIGHRCESTTDVDVLFRCGDTLAAEASLYARTLNLIASRMISTEDPTPVLTFNGAQFDFPILHHRCAVIDRDRGTHLTDRLSLLNDRTNHIDLLDLVIDDRGHRMSIDDVIAMLRIETHTPTWDSGRKVTGEDMLELGPRILEGDVTDAELDAVKRYAASDVRPLFDVHDRLKNRLQQ